MVWAAVSISPSPSYDGSYTVSFPDTPLGCHDEPSGYGFNYTFCSTLFEYGGSSGNWNTPAASTSKGFTNKYQNTYYYYVHTIVTVLGSSSSYDSNTASVVVYRTAPDPNSYYYISSGSLPHPSVYVFGWNATDAQDGCDVDLDYYYDYGTYVGTIPQHGLSSTGSIYVYDNYYGLTSIDYVQAKVTCHGPGGPGDESSRLEF